MSRHTDTREAYCPRCEAEREIVVTVGWQDDFCTRCGAPIVS